jgi:hypothetical protein
MAKKRKRNYDDPLLHADHARPVTRRDFVSQGFMSGSAFALGGGALSLFTNPREALAALSGDLDLDGCGISLGGANKIPFICFDLAGGANISGSNVLVGQEGGQMDFLSTSGYSKLGLPGDMVPGLNDANGLPYANTDFGLAFHSDSAFKRGMELSMRGNAPLRGTQLNGAIIPARSDNDTGNNPHNPLYGIAKTGSFGSILTLAGTENSMSGGNSMIPLMMNDPALQPTKIDRPGDVVGLVDTGELVGILSARDATAVLESAYRISEQKMGIAAPATEEYDLVRCGYMKAASIADRFGGVPLDPGLDPMIVDQPGVPGTGIFTNAEFFGGGRDGREFQKTASVMKLIMNGFAGAAVIEMGGYDYHGGARAEGEVKDFRAGRCMGACIEYAARVGVPLMMYVFSDGSLSSNGAIDNSNDGRGKGEWVSDNSSTAAGFFMVFDPAGRAVLRTSAGKTAAQHQQIGYFDANGSVVRGATPAANNVNLLVNTVLLNYMALHGVAEEGRFENVFPNHGLGNATARDALVAFEPIVNGTLGGLNPT